MKKQLIILTSLAAAALYLGFLLFETAAKTSETRLSFLDVGQGDSELIEFPGFRMLVDGGPGGKVMQSLGSVLSPADRTIDILLMTHPQLDHFGGFRDVLKNYTVRLFISNGRAAETKSYEELASIVREKNIPWVILKEGDSIDYGSYSFQIISPSPPELVSKEVNDSSIVLLIKGPTISALFTGDIGEATEARLVKDYNVDVDILKVPHHGSRFSSSEKFLAEVTPLYAITEVGKNSYGHPTKETLSRLGAVTNSILRTDKNGTITLIPTKKGIVLR